jgi:hypothetical protein
MNNYSKDLSYNSLIIFLDWTASKGLMKSSTVSALKAASNKVLGILEDEEKEDISKIEFDNIFKRFKNLNNQELNPTSLKTYRSRAQTAIKEFLAYKNDPEKWRPSISQRKTYPKQVSKSKNINETTYLMSEIPSNHKVEYKSNHLSHHFPLRNEVIVSIEGLPLDLKMTEAKRLSAFLLTLCEDYQPEV